MGNLINLNEWKKKKAMGELDELSECLDNLIADLCLDMTPTPYYEAHSYDDIGTTFYANLSPNPTISDCTTTLSWISYILSELGKDKEANKIDNIVAALNSKVNTSNET